MLMILILQVVGLPYHKNIRGQHIAEKTFTTLVPSGCYISPHTPKPLVGLGGSPILHRQFCIDVHLIFGTVNSEFQLEWYIQHTNCLTMCHICCSSILGLLTGLCCCVSNGHLTAYT